MEHLWAALRDAVRQQWTLTRGDLPLGTWGLTRHEEKEVVIATGLTEVEARCTLVHELVHVDRGPVPAGWQAQEENRVSRIAARELLPSIRRVADALVWADWCLHEAAEELDVDVDTLGWRLRTLAHPVEISYMRKRFDEGEHDGESVSI